MIQREPDLEMLLELPLPGASAGEEPLDEQVIRQQVDHAFRSPQGDWEMGWGDPSEIVEELQSLLDLAGQYQAQNNPDNAATVFRVLADEVMDYRDAVVQDDEGRLSGLIDECVEGLGECLEAIQDGGQRETILRTLVDITFFDLHAGGISIGDEVPEILVDQTTPQEKQIIGGWIETALPKGNITLQVKVAQTADEPRPRESIRLYRELIESLIQHLGRENYAQAASYLRLVRETYLRLGEQELWQTLIFNLRQQHRNKPALQDELNRAGL
jgi:hypothetical protein